MNVATNLTDLEALRKSPGWQLVIAAFTEQMEKARIPPMVTGSIDEIAISAVSRSAAYQAFLYARDKMLGELIERERKAAQE